MSANYLPENVIFIPNQWANLRLAATKTCRTMPKAGTPWRLTLPDQFDKGSNSGSITSLFS